MNTLSALCAGKLHGSRELKLSAGLERMPPEIFDLSDSLQILDLSGNHLRDLPDDFERMSKLKILFLSQNDFAEYPRVLGRCPNLEMIGFKSNRIASISEEALSPHLRWLILTDNHLNSLPKSIGNASRLQKLMLAGNCLTSLPEELSACRNLELLRCSANCLSALPAWLVDLPRLAWLAWSGNPFCGDGRCVESHPCISWSRLNLTGVLGSGASGIISKAECTDGNKQKSAGCRTVAVKVFKGEVTSDGYPADEMSACLNAGNHPNLVKVEGRIADHPEGRDGLVLSLIPPNYRNLGQPPSYASCTRDTFPAGTALDADAVRRIAGDIGGLMAHVHRKNLNHGDLYAHNILVDDSGHAVLGDFGAASQLCGMDTSLIRRLEKLEVRAYGCLLDDILGLQSSGTTPDDELTALRDLCLSANHDERPLFSDILVRQN
jgi:hypothetical protein